MITLYDAERCPYCARVRIALAEKGIEHEVVAIDLSDRPAWLYEKNPLGKVPVIEEDAFVLPESAVIMEYLDERYPEPALLPADPAARGARAAPGLAVRRPARRRLLRLPSRRPEAPRGAPAPRSTLAARQLDFVDIAYVPWVIRATRHARRRPAAAPAMRGSSELARAALDCRRARDRRRARRR